MATTATPVTQIPAGTWTVDAAHSVVGFSVKHMGIATVRGTFDAFEGALVVDGDLASARIEATIEAASIDTREEQRDAHLRSADFLDAENHPTLAYRSTGVRVVDAETFVVSGELTMAGHTNPVELKAEIEGFETDPWGGERVGLHLSGSLSRKDYNMTFNQMLGGGNVLVSDTVKISLDVSAVRQSA